MEPHRCTVDSSEVLSFDLDIAVLDELVPSCVQLRSWGTSEDVVVHDFVSEEDLLGAKCLASWG